MMVSPWDLDLPASRGIGSARTADAVRNEEPNLAVL